KEVRNEYLASFVNPWIQKFYGDGGRELDVFQFSLNPLLIDPRLGFAFVEREIAKDAWRPYRLNADVFFIRQGLNDPELREKLREAFKLVNEDNCRRFNSLLNSLKKHMNEVFGEPKPSDIPGGFVMYQKFFDKGNEISPDTIPKKVEYA
ncbi:MAG: hypothetical protein NT157_01880, partial [Candidatus Micrarchaeota archaeon]|nr:hypothetical protein [Candidatus Micrarchaeota archaeon]